MPLSASQILYMLFILLVAAERVVELRLSKRNAAWALDRGGREFGQEHFRYMTALHSAFLAACVAEVALLSRPFMPVPGLLMLILALLAQGLRYWAIVTLGKHWNVRVIVVPGAPAVIEGPYRLIRHPNYLAVILEGVALPMLHGAWITALVFSLLNGWLLTVRINCEERALTEFCEYDQRLGHRRRFFPAEEP